MRPWHLPAWTGRHLPVAAAAALAIGAAQVGEGCGSSKSNGLPAQVQNSVSQLQLLTPSDVQQTPPDSPERAVLEWWRLMQFRSATDTLRLFVPEKRSRLMRAGYATLVFLDFGPWLSHAKPRIVSVERAGKRAIVFVQVQVVEPVGGKLLKRSEFPVAMSTDRRQRQWLLSDTTFFLEESQVLAQGRLKAEKSRSKR